MVKLSLTDGVTAGPRGSGTGWEDGLGGASIGVLTHCLTSPKKQQLLDHRTFSTSSSHGRPERRTPGVSTSRAREGPRGGGMYSFITLVHLDDETINTMKAYELIFPQMLTSLG